MGAASVDPVRLSNGQQNMPFRLENLDGRQTVRTLLCRVLGFRRELAQLARAPALGAGSREFVVRRVGKRVFQRIVIN